MSVSQWNWYHFPFDFIALDLIDQAGGWFVAGLLPALGSAVYKGVLFSTTSQPGWKDARWLGGYHANSAVVLVNGSVQPPDRIIQEVPPKSVALQNGCSGDHRAMARQKVKNSQCRLTVAAGDVGK